MGIEIGRWRDWYRIRLVVGWVQELVGGRMVTGIGWWWDGYMNW